MYSTDSESQSYIHVHMHVHIHMSYTTALIDGDVICHGSTIISSVFLV